MNTTPIKESRVNIRCDNRARALLDKAAAYAQTSVSDKLRKIPSFRQGMPEPRFQGWRGLEASMQPGYRQSLPV